MLEWQVTGLIDVCLIGEIQYGSDDEIPVAPMESGQCDTCLTLEVHHPSNRVFQRLPRSLVVEHPSHPKLQIISGIFLGGLDRVQIVTHWRPQDQARRHDGH